MPTPKSISRFGAVLLCLSLAALTACDDEPDRLEGPVAEGDAQEEFAERLCYEYEHCGCGELAGVALTGCETGMGFAWQASAEDAKEDGLKYDGACLTKRLNAMLDRGCATASVSQIPFCSGETCLVFHGTKTEGEDCEGGQSRSDCAQGLVCLGTCQVPCANTGFDIPEGEVCQDADAEFYGLCAEPLLCDPTSGTCLGLPVAGEPCLSGLCEDGFFCEFGADAQTCAPIVAVGGDCTLPQQCESYVCGTDLKCGDAPAEGENCTLKCADGLVCALTDSMATSATCNKVPGNGDACLISAEPCGPGLACKDGVCGSRPKEGQSCNSADGIPIQCADGLVCGAQLCSTTPNAPGCDDCPSGEENCVVRVCTVIPPAVCADSGGLLF